MSQELLYGPLLASRLKVPGPLPGEEGRGQGGTPVKAQKKRARKSENTTIRIRTEVARLEGGSHYHYTTEADMRTRQKLFVSIPLTTFVYRQPWLALADVTI